MIRVPPINPAVVLFVTLAVYVISRSPAVEITSWYRTLEDNARVGGVPTSLHQVGLALDLVGPGTAKIAELWRGLGLDQVDEGDHLHIELDGPIFRRS